MVVVVVLVAAVLAVVVGVFLRAVFGGSTFPRESRRDRLAHGVGVRPDAVDRPEGTGFGPWGMDGE